MDTGSRSVVEVPLVADETGRVFMANIDKLKSLGLVAREQDALTNDLEDELRGAFCFRPATDREIDEGLATHTALATRYHDFFRGQDFGAVTGDGRAGLLGDLVIRDSRSGRVVGVYDIQVKGIGTGLRPTGTDGSDDHGHGMEELRVAIKDAVFADYLERNGVATNGWLAVIATDRMIHYGSGPSERYEPAGLLVRGGNFMRIAHLNYFRDDPKAMRELLDHVNRQLSVGLGRAHALSFAGLYKQLVARKASELADLYWARVFHGSTTYDNIGLFETMDHGSMGTVDRAHPRSWSGTSPGYTKEPAEVLAVMYQRELFDLMFAAGAKQERKALALLDVDKMIPKMLEVRMTARALEHLGFDADDVRALMKRRRGEAKELAAVLHAVAVTAEDSGATHTIGPSGTLITDPARYDIFAAMAVLVDVAMSDAPEAAKLDRLLTAMNPLGKPAAKDRAAAQRLLRALQPVLAQALAGLEGEPREEKGKLIAEQALRINKPVDELDRQRMLEVATSLAARFKNGENPVRLRAELRCLMRRNVRRGPATPQATALRLRHGTTDKESSGWARLSRDVENNVIIEEYSDGVDDGIRVTVSGNPLELDDPMSYRLRYRLGDGAWQEAAPSTVLSGEPLFPLPTPGAVETIEVYVFDAASGRRWDNGGFNFGKGIELMLGSPLVDAELGAWARRQGRDRARTPAATIKAVAGHARRNNTAPPCPRRLSRLETPHDVRTIALPPAEGVGRSTHAALKVAVRAALDAGGIR